MLLCFSCFRAFARALLSTNLLCCSSQRTRRARLRASQSDVLEGGTPAITQVRTPPHPPPPPPPRSSASPLCSGWLSNSVGTTTSHPVSVQFFFLPVKLDIWRKWVIRTPSWTCAPNASGPCLGGAAPRPTALRPRKRVKSPSRAQAGSPC